jgi:hypothetical protein
LGTFAIVRPVTFGQGSSGIAHSPESRVERHVELADENGFAANQDAKVVSN